MVLFMISHMNKDKPHERRAELAPLDVIRVETVLSRYPVHRLAKSGTVAIEHQRDGRRRRDDGALGDRPSTANTASRGRWPTSWTPSS